jgi:hypothetical protein
LVLRLFYLVACLFAQLSIWAFVYLAVDVPWRESLPVPLVAAVQANDRIN